ncbi:MAG: helix-turn-helix transcriptional regulator [Clostridia bacterium]|nr:helix-turn-helix transcriptional regulator [Clostridia bacterium]
MDLKEFKEVVAQNIYYLRTKNHLTQYELGEKLNYSDKAISKWERAEGMPDAYIISKMSELFGVTVDYMLTPHSEQDKKVETRPIKKVKRIVSNIVSAGILFIALFIFSIVAMVSDYKEFFWQIFIYAIPVVVVYRIIFNSVWFRAKNVFLLTSILLWSLIASIYVAIANWSLWIIFIIGLPLQVIVFLAFRIKITVRFSKKPKRQKETAEQAEPTNEQK